MKALQKLLQQFMITAKKGGNIVALKEVIFTFPKH